MNRQSIFIVCVCMIIIVLFQFDKGSHATYSFDDSKFRMMYALDASDETELPDLSDMEIQNQESMTAEPLINKNPDGKKGILSEQKIAIHKVQELPKSAENVKSGKAKEVITLPEISESQISTVNFKVLSQKGRVDIVDLNGETYMDINSLAQYYGKKIGWDVEKEQFVCKLFGVELRGSSLDHEVYINGNPAVLDQPVYIINNVTYIPANAFAEELGAEVVLQDRLLEFKVRNVAKAAFKLFRS